MEEDVAGDPLVLDLCGHLGHIVPIHDLVVDFGERKRVDPQLQDLPFPGLDQVGQFELSAREEELAGRFPVHEDGGPGVQLFHIENRPFPLQFPGHGEIPPIPGGVPLGGFLELFRTHQRLKGVAQPAALRPDARHLHVSPAGSRFRGVVFEGAFPGDREEAPESVQADTGPGGGAERLGGLPAEFKVFCRQGQERQRRESERTEEISFFLHVSS